MATQPARGMRDFLPEDVRRREHVVRVIRDVYDRYGFEPLETPAVENIETLLGKYGDEGNKLDLQDSEARRARGQRPGRPRAALRPDRAAGARRGAVPAQLPKFFKRYQIQPVGAPIVRRAAASASSTSATSTASGRRRRSSRRTDRRVSDLTALGFTDFVDSDQSPAIHAACVEPDSVADDRSASARRARQARQDRRAGGREGAAERRSAMRRLPASPPGSASIIRRVARTRLPDNLRTADSGSTICGRSCACVDTAAADRLRIDPRLARGPRYYTGAIMEITSRLAGSSAAAGRYDNLIGMFLGSDVPACGFSLGSSGSLVIMQERGMFPPAVEHLHRRGRRRIWKSAVPPRWNCRRRFAVRVTCV
jgi:histidyl-tRNA synthetase